MTIRKPLKLEHIVVLARTTKRELYHYECYTKEDIQKSLPMKIFINGFDFTHRLTLSARLTRFSLTYIMEHYRNTSFRKIAQYFRERNSKKLLEKRHGPQKTKKRTRQLGTLDATLANMRRDKSDALSVPKPKPFTKSSDKPVAKSTPLPTFKAVPCDYGATELVMKEAKLKRTIGSRGFICYLQCLAYKLQNEFRASLTFHFDHSVFSYLVENDLKSEAELIEVMDSIFCKSLYPSRSDLDHLFRTMYKLNKVDVKFSVASSRLREGFDVFEDIIDTFLRYFEDKIKEKKSQTVLQQSLEHPPTAVPKKRKAPARKRAVKRKC